jgi:hypothetical protein
LRSVCTVLNILHRRVGEFSRGARLHSGVEMGGYEHEEDHRGHARQWPPLGR